MRRAAAAAVLRVHVWSARRHAIEPGYNRCGECHGVWPCWPRRETDERVARFDGPGGRFEHRGEGSS